MSEIATAEQVAEYEAQLANIEELLAASPDDEAMLTLKAELTELLQLTKASLAEESGAQTAGSQDEAEPSLTPTPSGIPPEPAAETASLPETNDEIAAATAVPKEKKKSKKLKDFVVPPHLIVNDQDSEADKKKKRRALKALKSQHRTKQKEREHEKKQKSWQSFQKKKKTSGSSIFATRDSVDGKVGVVSKRTKTEFGQRTRHK